MSQVLDTTATARAGNLFTGLAPQGYLSQDPSSSATSWPRVA